MRHRQVPHGQLRAVEVNGKPVIRLQIIRYNVLDSFKWVWEPGCFNRTLNERWPQMTWGHEWKDMLGRGQHWEEPGDGPVVDFYLDDFDAVPRAKQAYAQVKSGTVDDCSIGFDEPMTTRPPTEEERKRWPGVEVVCSDASLNEVSLVLRGAVPGAKVLALRSAEKRVRGVVAEDTCTTIIAAAVQAVSEGTPKADALMAALQDLKDAVQPEPVQQTKEAVEEDTPEEEQPEETAVEAVDDQDTEEVQEEAATPEAPYGHDLEELLADVDALLAEKDAAP